MLLVSGGLFSFLLRFKSVEEFEDPEEEDVLRSFLFLKVRPREA